MNQLPDALLCIDGEMRAAEGGNTFDNICPWTAEVVGQAADGTAADVEAAIASSRKAFDETDWSTNHAKRIELVTKYAQLLRENRDTLMQIARLEAGSSIGAAAFAQVDNALTCGEDMLKCFEEVEWEEDRGVREFMGGKSKRTVYHTPLGVVAAITPWNVPLYVNIGKVYGALLAGCTVVLKPAPDTPLMGSYMGELGIQAGLPPGVLNVVTSKDPAMAGEILTRDHRVDVISFTGSTLVGKRIMENGAESLKRLFLELGGKSVNIILDDAEDFAMKVMTGMAVFHAGQGCAMPTRMLVPKSRYEEAVSALEMAYGGFANMWGDFDAPDQVMGPVISKRQHERVMSYIELGQQEGARLLAGGKSRPDKGNGFFIEPTCFVDCTNDMRIAREEIFGPVLCVIPFEDDEDAIRIANDSDYGLGGGVHGSVERATAIAKRIHAGALSVNSGMSITGDLPFGGFKQSGMGREWGREGIEDFLDTKVIAIGGQ